MTILLAALLGIVLVAGYIVGTGREFPTNARPRRLRDDAMSPIRNGWLSAQWKVRHP